MAGKICNRILPAKNKGPYAVLFATISEVSHAVLMDAVLTTMTGLTNCGKVNACYGKLLAIQREKERKTKSSSFSVFLSSNVIPIPLLELSLAYLIMQYRLLLLHQMYTLIISLCYIVVD